MVRRSVGGAGVAMEVGSGAGSGCSGRGCSAVLSGSVRRRYTMPGLNRSTQDEEVSDEKDGSVVMVIGGEESGV